jgi:hypothetical protein
MSGPALRSRETVTIMRSESNGALYLAVAVITLGAVGFSYWMFASYPRPAFTMTSVMSAPTAGPAVASGDMRQPPDRPASDNRPRDSAPRQNGQAPPRF